VVLGAHLVVAVHLSARYTLADALTKAALAAAAAAALIFLTYLAMAAMEVLVLALLAAAARVHRGPLLTVGMELALGLAAAAVRLLSPRQLTVETAVVAVSLAAAGEALLRKTAIFRALAALAATATSAYTLGKGYEHAVCNR
jgi:hypothetical protein